VDAREREGGRERGGQEGRTGSVRTAAVMGPHGRMSVSVRTRGKEGIRE
jgi:hypothetical protein